MIKRLAAGARREQRARDVDHVRRAGALVGQRRAAGATEATHRLRARVLVTTDQVFAGRDAEALAPASDIGRVGRPVGAPSRGGMVVPRPARRHIDLEGDAAAEAAPGSNANSRGFGHEQALSTCHSGALAKRASPESITTIVSGTETT